MAYVSIPLTVTNYLNINISFYKTLCIVKEDIYYTVLGLSLATYTLVSVDRFVWPFLFDLIDSKNILHRTWLHRKSFQFLFAFYCRLLLVWKPLHYKLMVTKRKLHLTVISIFFIFFLETVLSTLLFHQPYSVWRDYCSSSLILKPLAYYCIIILNYVVLNVIMTVSFFILVKMWRKKAQMSQNSEGSIETKSSEMIQKLTKATATTLGVYILLQASATVLEFVGSFVSYRDNGHGQMIADYVYIVFYLNNAINPVIYYFTLNDFREGYRRFCLCCHDFVEETTEQFTEITTIGWKQKITQDVQLSAWPKPKALAASLLRSSRQSYCLVMVVCAILLHCRTQLFCLFLKMPWKCLLRHIHNFL